MTQPLALVVGGSGAIGTAVIEQLVNRGYTTLATYCKQERPPRDGLVSWVQFDAECGSAQEIRDGIQRAGGRLQLVAYISGVPSMKQVIFDTEVGEFERLFRVNALGLVMVWRAIGDQARADSAAVVVLSSDAVRIAGSGNGPYTASKAALEAIAMTLAKEEATHGVRVNVVAPSLVESPLAKTVLARRGITNAAIHYAGLPWNRALSVDEVAAVVLAIGVDEAWRYASGQIQRLVADIGIREI